MKIEQLITTIQKRPGMFVKEEKIEYIYYLLLGFCGASKNYANDNIEQKFCYWFGKWLIIWIEDNVDAEYAPQTAYWYDDIKRITKKGQNEVTIFFDLCKSFFEDYKNKIGYFSWRD